MPKKPVYLDYAASTPVAPEVMHAMAPYFSKRFGNPESLHTCGQESIRALDLAREAAARAINAGFREVVFTSSATEANNLALRGAIAGIRNKELGIKTPRIIISAVEHDSVMETARALEREGAELVMLPVNREGVVDLDALKRAVNERTALVSVMYVNNVTGAIQPIPEITRIIREFRASRSPIPDTRYQILDTKFPLFHTDAAQAFLHMDCSVETLGVDLMTLSSHKIYGPKGAALLYVRRNHKSQTTNPKQLKHSDFRISDLDFRISPVTTGGHQEFGLRAGTQNVPAIVGYASALELASRLRVRETKRVTALRARLMKKLRALSPHLEINAANKNAPHILNILIPELPQAHVTAFLDTHGLAVSSGSACTMHRETAAPTLLAMSVPEEKARASIRISLGRPTKTAEIDEIVKRLENILKGAK